MLRQALLLHRMGDAAQALKVLEAAQQRYSPGVLLPERAALMAKIYLAVGQPRKAALAIELVDLISTALYELRYEVAKALVKKDPDLAQRIAKPLLEDAAPAHLQQRVRTLLQP